jgi:hypothetical protein
MVTNAKATHHRPMHLHGTTNLERLNNERADTA